MKSSVRQTKIPFSERKLRVRNKCTSPKKIESSEEETSPLKYKLVVSSESKIILRRSNSHKDKSVQQSPRITRSTPKRERDKSCGSVDKSNEEVDFPTPSKRKYCLDEPENVKTPSSMLSRLRLSSAKSSKNANEKSPKNESPKRHLNPKELFPNSNASSARKALYSSSNYLPCREAEINQLFTLLDKHLKDNSCGSIYVSGLPGTGKTASVEHVIQSEKIKKAFHIVKINCTSVTSSAAIYKRICSELKIKTAGKAEKDPKVLLEKFLLRKHKMILLILDEIDQLETRSRSVLYKIFEWPTWKNARLILIGIANAMDLTDRILPRLCIKTELKPVLLHFVPYTKDQIKKILSHRLSEVGADNVFTPSAIELISAKVAGLSGDVRRALDLGRRVMEITEEKSGCKLECIEKSPQKKIDSNAINSDIFTDFIKSSSCRRSPRKLNTNVHTPLSKNRIERDTNLEILNSEFVKCIETTPNKNVKIPFLSPNMKKTPQAKKKLFIKDSDEKEVALREIKFNDNSDEIYKASKNHEKSSKENAISPVKSQKTQFSKEGINSVSPAKRNRAQRESPRKHLHYRSPSSDIKSPRKNDFSIDSKDVLHVVKNIFGSSKTLKNVSEDSSFPLHQKLLICTFLLISNKGKIKDLNIGKLHQVYKKICMKRSITPVDQSGFLFLCRQVEMTGIMQIGKGFGKLAKISLQWDENEVADALKDLNLLSSILNDVSCL